MLQRNSALKNSGHQRDVTDNGRKKEAGVENSKATKCKIVGDAYRMSCDAVIIIVMRLPSQLLRVH